MVDRNRQGQEHLMRAGPFGEWQNGLTLHGKGVLIDSYPNEVNNNTQATKLTSIFITKLKIFVKA